MALSGDNCGRTFANAEVAAEGLNAGSLYGIRASCPNTNIFEFCEGPLPVGSRSYETLRHHGRSSKATTMYDGDQDFDQSLSDMEFVFGGQSVGVGSILSHLNHTETFPTGCGAAHSGENIGGKVFPGNVVEPSSADVRLGHVYDRSSGHHAFSVGGMRDDIAAASQVMPGLLQRESKVEPSQGNVLSSQAAFPFRNTQAISSDLPSSTSHCKECEPESKKSKADDFDWSTFSMIDPLRRFSQINGPKTDESEGGGRWFHSTPNSGHARSADPVVTGNGAPTFVKDSLVNDSLRIISHDEQRNKPQIISTTVPHSFAREVPLRGPANEFPAESTPVFCPPAACKPENRPDSLERSCDRSAGNTFETLRPVAPAVAGISVESFSRGSKCTSKVETSATDESNVKEDSRRDSSFGSSSKTQPVLDRRKTTQDAKPFFDPRRIFATASSKPPQKTSSQPKQTVEEGRTSDHARGKTQKEYSDGTNSYKTPDGVKSKETQKRTEEKIAGKSSDGAGGIVDAQKKPDEKAANAGSKKCVLNNNKSPAQSHSFNHTLDRSHFIKNDLSDLRWRQKNADVRADYSGRGVHDRISEQEQEAVRLQETTQVTEGVADEKPSLRKVENTTEVAGERQDVREDNGSTKSPSYLLKIIKEKIISFAVWAFYEILPIVLNMLKLVIGIIFHEVFSIAYHICRIAWRGLMWFCRLVRQRTFPKQDESGQDEGPRSNWWHNHGKQGVHAARANGNRFLSENITLPESGDEAIRRLFSCEGKDPYSILGLKVDCTDEEIRKYFRRQAVLVHPDKNREPGAEEAFKILNHAFELIGEPEKRQAYNAQTAFAHDEDIAMHQFSDLLTKLHEAMQESMKYMGCSVCGGKHKRVPVNRLVREARYCTQCDRHHAAKEGDVWAESSRLGFLWRYYACMEGQIYDVTEWASCQQDELRHIPANSHQVLIHISTGRNRQQRSAARDAETELKDLLESMYGTPGGASDMSAQCGRGAANDPGWKQGGGASKRRRRRRR